MIWLVGAKGMLGSDIALALSAAGLEFIGTDIETDITDKSVISNFASLHKFDWIINCCAYTAVDKAEADEDRAFVLNADGVGNLAACAAFSGAKMVHFSTDYVFSGDKEGYYSETDATSPISAYGRTKLAGEFKLAEHLKEYFVFRISWLYGVHGNNFVKTMVRLMNERDSLSVVSDQKGAPTYAKTLAENIVTLIKSGSDKYGIYHYSDDGVISWYDFSVEILKQGRSLGLIGKDMVINSIPSSAYPTPAKRPANSCFDKSKVRRELGFVCSPWQENLKSYFTELGA